MNIEVYEYNENTRSSSFHDELILHGPNKHETEKRLYAMLPCVDDTKKNEATASQEVTSIITKNTPKNTVCYCFHTSDDNVKHHESNDSEVVGNTLPITNYVNDECLSVVELLSNDIDEITEVVMPPKPSYENDECLSAVDLLSSDDNDITEVVMPPKPDECLSVVNLLSSDDDAITEVIMPRKPIIIENCDEETMRPLDKHFTNENVDCTKSIVENDYSHETRKRRKRKLSQEENINPVIDLTNHDECLTLHGSRITENVVFVKTPNNRESEYTSQTDTSKLGSTKIPSVLFEDLDFDHLKGTETTRRTRKFSKTTVEAEIEKNYHESRGGENFEHTEIQKSISRDENLWAIIPRDRMGSSYTRKVMCNYCNRRGHRDDSCPMKPIVCYMCGETGHSEPDCPNKICVNCGTPNSQYTTECFNCSTWKFNVCEECGQTGHPNTHCPDLWRRYHNTINDDTPLHENHSTKEPDQLFCSGCAQRGHLVDSCPDFIPFSGLSINSPYVVDYRPVYLTDNSNITQHTNSQDVTINSMPSNSFINDGCNLQSKSPRTEA